jgi:hypothetical protein
MIVFIVQACPCAEADHNKFGGCFPDFDSILRPLLREYFSPVDKVVPIAV